MRNCFLGLDLSTQQLKGILVDDDATVIDIYRVHFDTELPQYKTVNGVYKDSDASNTGEVRAPVAMMLEAVDLLFCKIKSSRPELLKSLIRICGACQQHGTVFWKPGFLEAFQNLEHTNFLVELSSALAWDLSPNWQDHSTKKECEEFEACVGGPEELAKITGSAAHFRFSGPQILRLRRTQSDIYSATARIQLLSSFLASVLAGADMGFDISDICGMNLWDIRERQWHRSLVELIGPYDEVVAKLGPTASSTLSVSRYFVDKYGVSVSCTVSPFTGDNPATILALPLEPNDVVVSLGTSTTALIVTKSCVTSPLYHVFAHPTLKESYMGMLCYCNGALAREKVLDTVNSTLNWQKPKWAKFDELALKGLYELNDKYSLEKIGFYFPLNEIIPKTSNGIRRIVWNEATPRLVSATESTDVWRIPEDDVFKILESQAMSIKCRLASMLTTAGSRPRKVIFVGGSSTNRAICQVFTRILWPIEGAQTMKLTDACALGAAHKAVFDWRGDEDWTRYIENNSSRQQLIRDVITVESKGLDIYANQVERYMEAEIFMDQ